MDEIFTLVPPKTNGGEIEKKTDKAPSAPSSQLSPESSQKAMEILGSFPDSLGDPNFRRQLIEKVEAIGLEEMKTAARKSKLLSLSVTQLAQAGAEGGPIFNSLERLKETLGELDPFKVDFDKKSSFFGLVNPVKSYFNRYMDSEDSISNILASLEKDRSGLKNDNITLSLEQKKIAALNEELKASIDVSQAVYGKLSEALPTLKDKGDDEANFVEEKLLFPISQRLTDLQQVLLSPQWVIMRLGR